MQLIKIQLNYLLVIVIGAEISQWVYWLEYGLDDRAVWFDSRQEQKASSSPLRLGSPVDSEGSAPGAKEAVMWSWPLTSSAGEVMNAWSYTSTSSYAFMAWCPIEHSFVVSHTDFDIIKRVYFSYAVLYHNLRPSGLIGGLCLHFSNGMPVRLSRPSAKTAGHILIKFDVSDFRLKLSGISDFQP
jgi:hypothetical protein